MASKVSNLSKLGKSNKNHLQQQLFKPSEFVAYVHRILFTPLKFKTLMLIFIPIELILNLVIIYNIKYTEIDWIAYMQEVEGFLNGTLNYYELKGDTGPLVYPAGFVYVYSILYWLTNNGSNIRIGQFIFVLLYIMCLSAVFFIYSKTRKVPFICFIVMCFTSHRIHSIFVLRLFNDPIAMLFLYLSIALILEKRSILGSLFFSLAVSIKMNVLLFAPGLFVILVLEHGLLNAINHILICGTLQLILGAPFLIANPVAYVHRSFEFSRQFFYIWTVNWKCIPEDLFLSRYFQIGLLFMHLFILFIYMNKILKNFNGIKDLLAYHNQKFIKPDSVILIMFISNFIGICFSRSLHYQFYVWYYHTFAYLLWITPYWIPFKLLLFGLIELTWNVYPSTFVSSILMHFSHFAVLLGVWKALNKNEHFEKHV